MAFNKQFQWVSFYSSMVSIDHLLAKYNLYFQNKTLIGEAGLATVEARQNNSPPQHTLRCPDPQSNSNRETSA